MEKDTDGTTYQWHNLPAAEPQHTPMAKYISNKKIHVEKYYIGNSYRWCQTIIYPSQKIPIEKMLHNNRWLYVVLLESIISHQNCTV